MKTQRDDYPPPTLRVEMVNGKIHINVSNTGKGDLNLYKDQSIGVIDLTSAGYYHITRDSLRRCLQERSNSFSEEKSQDYILHMYTSDDKRPQIDTGMDKRTTPIKETQRP